MTRLSVGSLCRAFIVIACVKPSNYISFLLWAGAASPLLAQSPEVVPLPEVVVKAKADTSLTVPDIETKREELAQIPGAAEVIDADSYKHGRATTIRDALDFAPGVFVQSRFGAEEARISIRGSGIQRTFQVGASSCCKMMCL